MDDQQDSPSIVDAQFAASRATCVVSDGQFREAGTGSSQVHEHFLEKAVAIAGQAFPIDAFE